MLVRDMLQWRTILCFLQSVQVDATMDVDNAWDFILEVRGLNPALFTQVNCHCKARIFYREQRSLRNTVLQFETQLCCPIMWGNERERASLPGCTVPRFMLTRRHKLVTMIASFKISERFSCLNRRTCHAQLTKVYCTYESASCNEHQGHRESWEQLDCCRYCDLLLHRSERLCDFVRVLLLSLEQRENIA